MKTQVDIVEGNPIEYDVDTDIISYKNIECKVADLVEAVDSPIDRIKVKNTDLLLKKHELTYQIGCLTISKEQYKNYKKNIFKLKKQWAVN